MLGIGPRAWQAFCQLSYSSGPSFLKVVLINLFIWEKAWPTCRAIEKLAGIGFLSLLCGPGVEISLSGLEASLFTC